MSAPSPVVAVVPSYRPGTSISTLLEVLAADVPVLVADDASPVTSDRALRTAAGIAGVRVRRHGRRAGIARGLNAGLAMAVGTGAQWLLTVDQDSRVPAGYARDLLRFATIAASAISVGAVGASEVLDRSGPIRYGIREEGGLQLADELIQSGTLWSVGALTEIGGFDETFGIDAVDAAASVRLRRAGFSLVLAPGSAIEHRLGDARPVRLLGREVLATGHSPERRASMVRNRVRLLPEEAAVSPAQALRSARRLAVNTALALTVEEDRWAKAKGSLRGLVPRRGK